MDGKQASRATAASVLGLLILLAPSAGAGGLRSEIERLREIAGDPALGDNAARVREAVDAADAALAAGRVHLAAENLAGALVLGEAFAYRAAHQDVEDLEAFAAEWRAQAPVVDRVRELVTAGVCRGAPSHLRGLAEAGLNQAPAYYHGGGAMGTASSIGGGLVYLGHALGSAKIATWCDLMRTGERRTPPVLRSLGREVAALEAATEVEYARPGAALAEHAAFIRLNATIKELRELDGKGLRFGALYKYLDGLLQLRRIARPEAEGDRAALLERAAEIDVRLAGSATDHGIARIFLERAATALEAPEPETADLSTAKQVLAEQVLAQHILDDVLPAYFAIVGVPRP
jgi:hypothetical protein